MHGIFSLFAKKDTYSTVKHSALKENWSITKKKLSLVSIFFGGEQRASFF